MNLIGIRVSVGNSGWNNGIREDKVEINKETDKIFKVGRSASTIFDSLTNIPKDRVDIIQKENKYVNSIERTMWILEDENYNRNKIIEQLKQSIYEEIDSRTKLLNSFIKTLESL